MEIGRIRIGAYAAAAGAAAVLLCGCASTDTVGSMIVAPGKYDFYSCEQIAIRMKTATTRERELKSLVDKAERDTVGTVVSALAYRTDYATARGDVLQLQEAAKSKNCPPAP